MKSRPLTLEELNEMLLGADPDDVDFGRDPGPTSPEELEKKLVALGLVKCVFCSEKAQEEFGIKVVWHRATAGACAEVGFAGDERVN